MQVSQKDKLVTYITEIILHLLDEHRVDRPVPGRNQASAMPTCLPRRPFIQTKQAPSKSKQETVSAKDLLCAAKTQGTVSRSAVTPLHCRIRDFPSTWSRVFNTTSGTLLTPLEVTHLEKLK